VADSSFFSALQRPNPAVRRWKPKNQPPQVCAHKDDAGRIELQEYDASKKNKAIAVLNLVHYPICELSHEN
jgi:hypothetical protein